MNLNMKKVIYRIKLNTTKSNISVSSTKIGKWFFSSSSDGVVAYAIDEYDKENISDPFDAVTSPERLNLGLLVDALTIATNQDINTSFVISTNPIIDVFSVSVDISKATYVDLSKLCKPANKLCNASTMGEAIPPRMNNAVTLTLPKDSLEVIDHIISFLSLKKNFRKQDLKLMNYWRKGVDLDNVGYTDESFLSFFKIIEYFINKPNIQSATIPSNFKSSLSMQDAYRFSIGANVKSLSDDQYEMISDFVHLRNNWDIAHVNMKLPETRERGLYYSHLGNFWSHHSDICQITRFVTLKNLGLKKMVLKPNGGLYELFLNNK